MDTQRISPTVTPRMAALLCVLTEVLDCESQDDALVAYRHIQLAPGDALVVDLGISLTGLWLSVPDNELLSISKLREAIESRVDDLTLGIRYYLDLANGGIPLPFVLPCVA